MFQTHSNAALDGEMLSLMKQAGCAMFGYGLESASPAVLKSMNKRSKLENIVEGITLSESVGISFSGNLIFGDPAEDGDTIRETMAFFWGNCMRMHISIGSMQIYPGSLLFDKYVKQGMIRSKKEFYATIDERIWNMTCMPSRIWYPWILMMSYFPLTSPHDFV